ncbi:glycosyltransferase family 2 protein [Ruegeria arenilitoris]|uniref:glycosyltransferase family 2 protein n=1 Tax=Ruegeria arenilitoris TaxID=1173585 RepID=UPI00147EE12C|nr:glycosyltransferase family 2 protein [Ruegeria arenilitoris]
MVELNLQGLAPATPVPGTRPRKPLGACLVGRGVINQTQLQWALNQQTNQNARLGEILLSEGWIDRQNVLQALSDQNGLQIADLKASPPSADLFAIRPAEFWVSHGVAPWMRIGPILQIATARPDQFEQVANELSDCGHTVVPVLASAEQINTVIAAQFSSTLAEAAENRVDAVHSCRNWTARSRVGPIALLLAALVVFLAYPPIGLAFFFWSAVSTLILFLTLRIFGLGAYLLSPKTLSACQEATQTRMPVVSMMVPLYKEREIADALIVRLGRLTYPKALLDVILVLEEHDDVTRAALKNVDLPSWIRVLEVPELGNLTTKPRAMNYALDFCRGDIIGVWDAEDAPQPDQIETVVRHFERAADDVVCLQGALDYYNPRTNWRSRCFTIEYSGWFRVILPGIAKLGLVVPLGGTTFFFRRDKLLELGGWDAHNVTEDADLGVRLSRAGYRTEIVETTTYEEANFRAWPWVKQRSRWLKGFMVTYLVHMRAPLRFLNELGPLRFMGVQAFFLGTVGQFLLAPVLWMFWLTSMGLPHPFLNVVTPEILKACIYLFLAAEAANFIVGALGVNAGGRRFLLPWVPTLILYYPLGVLAAYKALWELAAKPFFWDKTQHGQAHEEAAMT